MAAAIAMAASAAGCQVGLIDLQAGGPGLDVVLGIEHRHGVRWPDLVALSGAVDGAALRDRLPWCEAVAVLSHARDRQPVPGDRVTAAVVDGLRDAVDLLVLDVPRERVLAGLAEVGVGSSDIAVVVSGSGVVELAALHATAGAVATQVSESFIVLRGQRRAKLVLDDVRAAIDLPVLRLLGEDPAVGRELRRGIPPGSGGGPIAEAALDVLAVVLPGVTQAPGADVG